MASIIRLQPHHTKCFSVENLLVVDAKPMTPEQIEQACQDYLDGGSRDDAIMAFASCIRHITGRWLATFPVTRTMEDDLVSVGMETVIESIDKLEDTEDVTNVITNRVLDAQTRHINDYRSASAPSLTTQRQKWRDGKEVHYSRPLEPSDDRPDGDQDLEQFEFVDLMFHAAQDDLDLQILHPSNWACSHEEIAERLEVDQSTINRRVRRLQTVLKEQLEK